MSLLQTNNPAFAGTIFGDWEHADRRTNSMTVSGTAIKAIGLLAIVFACAAVTWTQIEERQMAVPVIVGSAIFGLILYFVTIFRKQWAGLTAPLYAACEGILLGAISNMYNNAYHGIVAQAVGLTFLTAGLMLFLYATGLVKVTGRLVACVTAGMGALAVFYLGAWISSMFGAHGGVQLIYSSTPLGIAISVFATGLAAFKLLLDFDYIERGAGYDSPKYMEWYSAFALMVTLIWLYLEILNLLRKLMDRR